MTQYVRKTRSMTQYVRKTRSMTQYVRKTRSMTQYVRKTRSQQCTTTQLIEDDQHEGETIHSEFAH